MGRKVFISFLGNTKYSEATYIRLDGTIAPKTHFVQEVLFDEICQDWDSKSKIYVICTKGQNGSYDKNWKDKAINGISLKTILDQKGYHDSIEPIELEEGSERDVWNLFSRIDELIDPNDSIYLDITNAFRSFPSFATTLLQYEKHMKNIDVKGVYYGLYDRDAETNPIQNLLGITQLQECVEMANGLVKYGRIADLAEGLNTIDGFEEVSETLKDFDQSWASIICDSIQRSEFKGKLNDDFVEKISRSQLPKPTKDLMRDVINRLSDFKYEGGLENLLAASRWASKSDLLPQAYAFGKEYLNRKAEELLHNVDPFGDEDSKRYLEFINSILTMPKKDVENGKFKGDLAYYQHTTKFILGIPWVGKFRKLYVTFNTGRNVILHAKSDYDYKRLRGIYDSRFEKCVSLLQAENIVEKPIVSFDSSSLFINLSNHPSANWSEIQIEAAKKYGKIIDVEFPSVDETLGEDYIRQLVEDRMAVIMTVSNNLAVPVTVHIMGEMTFTFAMVTELKKCGCKCVASTTKRIAEEFCDGTKTSRFEFCKFREY